MKKKLLGTLLFSVALSSLAYAEADADKATENNKVPNNFFFIFAS